MSTGKHVLRAKKKDKKPENNEISEKKPGQNDEDEITGQTLVAGSSNNNEDDDKNNDNIKKNKLINQKFKVGDGNNEKDGNNDDIPLRTNRIQSVNQDQARIHSQVCNQRLMNMNGAIHMLQSVCNRDNCFLRVC